MAIDINNLPDILRQGKITGEGTKMTWLTPVCRASFVNLAEEEIYQGKPTGRYSLSLLLETEAGKPAAVDPATFSEFFQKSFDAYEISPEMDGGSCLYKKGRNVQEVYHLGEKFAEDGKKYSGYGPKTIGFKANNKIGPKSPKFQCYDVQGREADPEIIYSGCYVRCNIGLWVPKDWPNLSIQLKTVQFVADGERFTGDGLVMDAIPGAEPPPADAVNGDLSQFV